MIEFENRKHGGMRFRSGDRAFKFTRGRMVTDPAGAQLVRAFARAHPEYGIVEARPVTPRMTRDELAEIARVRGVRVTTAMTKRELLAAMGGG